jgi:SAM-dependent methyltransferase
VLSSSEFIAVNCPLCGANNSKLHIKGDDYLGMVDGECNLQRCRECGLVYLSPRPHYRDIIKLYPESYDQHNISRYLWVRRLKQLRQFYRVRSLKKHLPEKGRLLEIGCGSGDLLIELARLGYITSGLDFSSVAVETARQTYGLDVTCGIIEDVDFQEGSFDAILMFHVIEHLTNPLSAMKQLRFWLKPGGALILGTPDVSAVSAKVLRECWQGYDFPRHMLVFEEKTINHIAKQAGFSTVDIFHELDGNDWIWGLRKWRLLRRYRWWSSFWSVENPIAQIFAWPIAIVTYLMRRSGRMVAVLRR